ncbi:ABC transporter ATP-binding protein [Corynebacterium kutscheri]|uniref:ABC transporter ATP-binding protein/permease n=1 Tax=Corynebacterium kutscheri TaxID=35755 RepID=UPI000F70501C|nr:ATP-binding cassette domain-containing protein [Corynebacterium kutscheri]VEH80156.1 ABC transporter ATP-binding protein [Corynebacterium kutscheri]
MSSDPHIDSLPTNCRGMNSLSFWLVPLYAVLSYLAAGIALATMASVLAQYIHNEEPYLGSYVVIGAAILTAGIFTALDIRTGAHNARNQERHTRHQLLAALYDAPTMSNRDRKEFHPGKLVALLTDNVERSAEFQHAYLGSALASMAFPIAVVSYIALAYDWVLGLSMLGQFILVPLLLHGFMRLFRNRSSHSRRKRAGLSEKYLDAIRNLTTISLINAGSRIEHQLRAEGERNRSATMKLLAGNQMVIIVMDLAVSLILICTTVAIIAIRVTHGSLSPSHGLASVFLLVLLLAPLSQVAGFFYVGMGGIAAQRAIKKYLHEHKPAESTINGETTSTKYDPTSPAIVVDTLSFSYGDTPVLNNISLTVAQGTKIAIVGRSGSGKSTLLHLIRGLLPATPGTVLIQGQDTATTPLNDIRTVTATVAQQTWLFSGSIADNLRIARIDVTESDMWEALSRANLAAEVRTMPNGLATDVGERGAFLSGGQAQRLSLARALLSGRDIVLFDEPTSHIDLESEALIVSAIQDLPAHITAIMVTHRPALLAAADTVYTMEAGDLR